MYTSFETSEQTAARLQRVLALSSIEWIQGAHAFYEYPVDSVPIHELHAALALVRDTVVWSALKPALPESDEQFAKFSVHFPEGVDNSGFVGWLATLFKVRLGTGVAVVCGHNAKDGGIFDYWVVPYALRGDAATLLAELVASK